MQKKQKQKKTTKGRSGGDERKPVAPTAPANTFAPPESWDPVSKSWRATMPPLPAGHPGAAHPGLHLFVVYPGKDGMPPCLSFLDLDVLAFLAGSEQEASARALEAWGSTLSSRDGAPLAWGLNPSQAILFHFLRQNSLAADGTVKAGLSFRIDDLDNPTPDSVPLSKRGREEAEEMRKTLLTARPPRGADPSVHGIGICISTREVFRSATAPPPSEVNERVRSSDTPLTRASGMSGMVPNPNFTGPVPVSSNQGEPPPVNLN